MPSCSSTTITVLQSCGVVVTSGLCDITARTELGMTGVSHNITTNMLAVSGGDGRTTVECDEHLLSILWKSFGALAQNKKKKGKYRT